MSPLKLLYFPFFRWNMWHPSRKQLIEFLFWSWHRKRYPFIFLHFLLCLSYKIGHHWLNPHGLEYASFYHCRNWFPILFVVKNWYSILIETINKSVKSVLRQRILIYFIGNFFPCGISSYNQIMSIQHIPPKCQDICSSFCSCINGSVSGYGYANSCGVQISGHIDIEFCL